MRRRVSSKGSAFFDRVVHHPIESRPLLSVFIHEYDPRDVPQGAIVWVEPDRETSDTELEDYRARLLTAGAARVKFLPRPSAEEALPRSPAERLVVHERLGIRDIVAALVDEVRGDIREPVRNAVESHMARAGL